MSVKCPVSIRKFPDGCFWIVDADGERIADDGSASGEYAETMSLDTARRIVACVNAMAGIGEDNAMLHPSKNPLTVRSVISSMKIKQLELEQQRDELLAAIDTMLNGASLVDIGNDCGIGVEDSDLESFNAVVNRIKAGAK